MQKLTDAQKRVLVTAVRHGEVRSASKTSVVDGTVHANTARSLVALGHLRELEGNRFRLGRNLVPEEVTESESPALAVGAETGELTETERPSSPAPTSAAKPVTPVRPNRAARRRSAKLAKAAARRHARALNRTHNDG